MALTLVTGPAGSGKTGEMLERFAAWLEREPLLVVPTAADVERFEDELLARRPVALGGRVVTFRRLFEIAADAAGVVGLPALTKAQRLAVLAAVVDDAGLRTLAEPARRPGFVVALERFIAETQAALITPARLRSRCAELDRRGQAAELASLYRAYVERRDALDHSDQHSLAADAVEGLRRQPGSWGSRPILVHGFDDLTTAQLALLEAAALKADVLVSVLHEEGRACLAARRSLVAAVERVASTEGEADGSQAAEQLSLALDADLPPAGHRSAARIDLPPAQGPGLLRHLERAFMTDTPARREPAGEVRAARGGRRPQRGGAGGGGRDTAASGGDPDVTDRSRGAVGGRLRRADRRGLRRLRRPGGGAGRARASRRLRPAAGSSRWSELR